MEAARTIYGVRYKILLNGGRATASPEVLAQLLWLTIPQVLERAKKGAVLKRGPTTIKIIDVIPLVLPAWAGAINIFEIEIDGGKAAAPVGAILELAGLPEDRIGEVAPGAEFEHKGVKIAVIKRLPRRLPTTIKISKTLERYLREYWS